MKAIIFDTAIGEIKHYLERVTLVPFVLKYTDIQRTKGKFKAFPLYELDFRIENTDFHFSSESDFNDILLTKLCRIMRGAVLDDKEIPKSPFGRLIMPEKVEENPIYILNKLQIERCLKVSTLHPEYHKRLLSIFDEIYSDTKYLKLLTSDKEEDLLKACLYFKVFSTTCKTKDITEEDLYKTLILDRDLKLPNLLKEYSSIYPTHKEFLIKYFDMSEKVTSWNLETKQNDCLIFENGILSFTGSPIYAYEQLGSAIFDRETFSLLLDDGNTIYRIETGNELKNYISLYLLIRMTRVDSIFKRFEEAKEEYENGLDRDLE